MKAKRIIKITAIVLACIIAAFALLAGGYVAYVAIQYYRIEDNLSLETQGNVGQRVQAEGILSVMTYNTGFGAYSPEYSFFMDTGVMDDGKEVAGIYAKGLDKADVQKNVDGQVGIIDRKSVV